MAIVYLAQDLRHERPVALKILHPELAATLGPDRFLREIKLAARLQHPHILTVLDSGETDGRLWFTMGDYLRRIKLDYAGAIEQYRQGERQSPSNADLFRGIGQAEQTLGRWDASLEHLGQAQRLDPRSAGTAQALTQNLLWMRRYDEALTSADRWIGVAPDNPFASETKAMILVSRGDLAAARAVVEKSPAAIPVTRFVAYVATYYEMYWLLSQEQQDLLLRLPPSEFDDDRASWWRSRGR